MKLIGSHGDLEGLRKRIENYYYSAVTLEPVSENEWRVVNSRGPIEGVRVIKKQKRFRFEGAI